MTTKTFEVRDKGTFIAVLATRLVPTCEADRYLLARAGFGKTPEVQGGYLMLTKFNPSPESRYGPFDWNNRTMVEAHRHIAAHFDALESGSVVDVQYIIGETETAKVSEAVG